MATSEQRLTTGTRSVHFGDWPVTTLEKNPLSPDDGCLEAACGQASYVERYQGYTIVGEFLLGAGVIYRPDSSPLLVRGKWLVVADKETARFCVELDVYWRSLEQSAAQAPSQTDVA